MCKLVPYATPDGVMIGFLPNDVSVSKAGYYRTESYKQVTRMMRLLAVKKLSS